ncbi:MAG: SIR2 family NAD-dependent protein deacylase [Flavobacteriales bacterium]
MHTKKRKNIVFLTGAGMSAESGIKTFRDADGLWEGHDIYEVASPAGFEKNPALVLDFYNQRRQQLFEVDPNKGHLAIADLESDFDVEIITQNVDDLHERAGSSSVLHLHGELRKIRSVGNPNYIKNWEKPLHLGDLCPEGHQLRPHIVWFGEAVPNMDKAEKLVEKADILVVLGTSLEVYPAASLIHFAPQTASVFIIDPYRHSELKSDRIRVISKGASEGMEELVGILRL